jgi:hypothetical protein
LEEVVVVDNNVVVTETRSDDDIVNSLLNKDTDGENSESDDDPVKVFFLSNIIVLNLLLKQVYFGFPIFRPLAQVMRDYFSKCASCAPDVNKQ